MSPNVGNFVHDLVEMAKAMETLPQVQAELDRANTQIENYAKQVQDREIAIISYKQEIDDLHAKVRSLEVERDDASFRVLEAEDIAHSVLTLVRTVSVDLALIEQKLSPPKPEPVKEPEPQAQPVATPAEAYPDPADRWEGWPDRPIPEAVHSISEVSSGQSESSPTQETASATSPSQENVPTQATSMGVENLASATSAEPTHGPYFGKRYFDIPEYIPRSEWLAGGGTEADYNWRPDRSSF